LNILSIFDRMYRAILRKVSFSALLFLTSVLFLQFAWRASATSGGERAFSTEKINLALRRMAHHMLSEAGDSLSLIAPVMQRSERVWQIRLEKGFNYDRLPALLQESFDLHGIDGNYDVAVLRCSDGEIQVGYNFLDFSQGNGVPCMDREHESGCYLIQVTFPLQAKKQPGLPLAGWVFSGMLALAAFGLGRKWGRAPEKAPEQAIATEADWLHFGQCRLDVANQILLCGEVRHQLTYREAKLLHLFVSRPNQLLERSFILQNVWADEGILVGRSVDMFVSRLRKMLRDDASVRLLAVHGVGYRLEV
jgi:hypothetical protein